MSVGSYDTILHEERLRNRALSSIGTDSLIVKISGETITVASGVYVVTTPAGGGQVSGAVQVSGTVNVASGVYLASGIYVVTTPAGGGQVSGAVRISGTVEVSGRIAVLSGLIAVLSGEVHIMSGQVTTDETPLTTVKVSGSPMKVAGDSGGVVLPTGAVNSVTVKSLSRNSGDIFVGSPTHPPCSGIGYVLEVGEAVTVDVDNMNRLHVCAQVSGDQISFIGLD